MLFGSHGAWQGYERLAPPAREAVQRAETLGAARGLRRTPPDLLLAALLTEADGVPARALAFAGVDVATMLAADAGGTAAVTASPDERAPLDEAAQEGVVLGLNEARRGGFGQAGAGHLLLGLVEERSADGARLIARAIRLSELRALVHSLERASADDGAALFIEEFAALLRRSGGARSCPHCGTALHRSFDYCYACGAAIAVGDSAC